MSAPVLLGFRQEQHARLLISYLRSQQIKAGYHFAAEQSHPHQILLKDAADYVQAKQIADEFLQNPSDKRYQQSAWEQGKTATSSPGLGAINWETWFAQMRSAPFCTAILLACIVTFISMFFHLSWVSQLRIQPLIILKHTHEWWRLLGPAFLHFGALHIVFNLLWWWLLGGAIERTFGSSMLAGIFLVTALVSNIGQLLVSGPAFGGLSGVVYGVLGFVWWCGWLRPQWGLGLPKSMVGFMLIWLVLGYADVLWISMANTAHTLGLVSGCACALLLSQFTPQKRIRAD